MAGKSKDPKMIAKIAKVRKLAEKGYTSRRTADKLKTTIGSIAGIAHRNGIWFGGVSRSSPKKKASQPKKIGGVKRPKTKPVVGGDEIKETILQLTTPTAGPPKRKADLFSLSPIVEETCQWSLKDPELDPESGKTNYHWCEKTAEKGKPYCSQHWVDAHKPPSAKAGSIFRLFQHHK